jgi:hypothetical protein
MSLNKYQQKLFDQLFNFIQLNDKNKFLIEAGGGSGKTFTVSSFIKYLIEIDYITLKNYKIHFIAPTNKAKNVINKTVKNIIVEDFQNALKYNDLNRKGVITFNTIHSFFKSKIKYDENGVSSFDVQLENCILFNNENKSFNHLVILDEVSMLNYDQYKHFMDIISLNNKVKMIFLGDRNQLSYIKEESLNNEYKEYLSPIFIYDNDIYFKLKGNERFKSDSISNIVNKTKKCVIKEKLLKLKKSDINDKVRIIDDREMYVSFDKHHKVITYTNKRRKEINDNIRKQIYWQDINLNRYKFVNDELVIVQNTFKVNLNGKEYNFLNNDDLHIYGVQYNKTEDISFLDIIRKSYIVQRFNLYNMSDNHNYLNETFYQISNKDIANFNNKIKILKKSVKLYTKNKFNYESSFRRCGLCENNCLEIEKTLKTCMCCTEKIIEKYKELNTFNKIYEAINELKNSYDIPLEYSYCITVYKSQGSTYDTVIVDYYNIIQYNQYNMKNLTRAVYVSFSRTKNELNILDK